MIPNDTPQSSRSLPIPRRTFVQLTASLLAGLSCHPLLAATDAKVRIGIIADLHQDLVPDAKNRLEIFLESSLEHKPDALIQLGDFATPIARNKPVIELFNSIDVKKFHVIGNHDTDGGLKIEQVVDNWGMKSRFYTEMVQGIKLIVLDCNDKPLNHRGGYPAHVADDQLEWLQHELQQSGPMLVVSHQPLAGPSAIDNATTVQKLLTAASDRILLVINGHTHIDELIEVGGVPYWHVNSASYYWVGSQYKHESLSKELHAKYPAMSSTCPYRDSLFALLEIDLAGGLLTLTGRDSAWIGPSPSDLGLASNPQITPTIRARSRAFPRLGPQSPEEPLQKKPAKEGTDRQ
jgi:predicted phosphodiesterase